MGSFKKHGDPSQIGVAGQTLFQRNISLQRQYKRDGTLQNERKGQDGSAGSGRRDELDEVTAAAQNRRYTQNKNPQRSDNFSQSSADIIDQRHTKSSFAPKNVQQRSSTGAAATLGHNRDSRTFVEGSGSFVHQPQTQQMRTFKSQHTFSSQGGIFRSSLRAPSGIQSDGYPSKSPGSVYSPEQPYLDGQLKQEFQVEQQPKVSFRHRVRLLLSSIYSIILMSLITTFALFGDDIKYLIQTGNQRKYETIDDVFNVFTIICMVVYTVEIILQCIADRREDEPETLKTQFIWRYFASFYFWLDVLSTVSMLLDITWFLDSMLDYDENSNTAIPDNLGIFSKTSRGVRIGSRAGRIARITKLFRAERMFSLYRNSKLSMKNVNMATLGDTVMMIETQNGQKKPTEVGDPNISKEHSSRDGIVIDGQSSQSHHYGTTFKKSNPLPTISAYGQEIASVSSYPLSQQPPSSRLFNPSMQGSHSRGQPNPNMTFGESTQQIVKGSQISGSSSFMKGTLQGRQQTHLSGYINTQYPFSTARIKDVPPLNEQNPVNAATHFSNNSQDPDDTKLGKKLSELTTKMVMILVLTFMLTVPIFTLSTYKDDSNKYQYGLNVVAESYPLHNLTQNTSYLGLLDLSQNSDEVLDLLSQFNDTLHSFIEIHQNLRCPLIYIAIENETVWTSQGTLPKQLRYNEKEIVTAELPFYEDKPTADLLIAVFDTRATSRLIATLSLLRTMFVCIALGVGASLFTRDANTVIIGPVLRMIEKIQRIATNPLEAASREDREALTKERLVEYTKKNYNKWLDIQYWKSLFKKGGVALTSSFSSKDSEGNDSARGILSTPKLSDDTAILEQTIVKVGALVALGFGEAGVKIISDNMGHTGDVDPMVPGHKVAAIFGFCTIRQFIETTEVLEESVMSFVNEIAELVHGVVDKFSGAPNKNIGDSFLCVWKFRDEDIEFNENTNNIQPIVCTAVQQLADMALISYLKTIAAVKRSAKLEGYRVREDMQEKMSKNFEVKMGFGLHVGWAIEGAIGSEFKIDASYLSPNVNMASRLEAATKQFGVSILMSGAFFSLLTPKCQEYQRHIDTVIVKGTAIPVKLYTCDIDANRLQVDKPNDEGELLIQQKEMYKRRVKHRIKRNRFREKAFQNQFQVSSLFETDKDIRRMRYGFKNRAFFDIYASGLKHYIKGNWHRAKEQFDKILNIHQKKDHPTKCLLQFMEEHDFKAPLSWNGHRALTEK